MVKTKVLFIGNFLSRQRGTIGPMEGVMNRMADEIIVKKASTQNHQALKFLDILWKALFSSYSVIHIDTYSTNALYFAFYAAKIAHLRGKKVVINLRGGGLHEVYVKHLSKKKLIDKHFHLADHIITPSLYLKEVFSKEGYRIEYLPNVVDRTHFPFQEAPVLNHRLLWVRAFNDTYQPWIAINALFEIRKKYPDTRLTMVGPDKGNLSKMKVLIQQLDLENIIDIVGKVPNQALQKYYHSHQVYLNTTNKESFGVAVMEAASCGIPIVSSSVGELVYLWKNEETALLIPNFEAEHFALAVTRLFEDKELYQRMKHNARKKAEQFDWEVVKKKWEKILNV